MAGSSIKTALLNRNIKVVGVSRSGSDILCDLTDENQITEILQREKYDAVINAAAQVNINRCEKRPLESWKINARLVSILANFCNDSAVPLLHISTDHFFNYGDHYPHKENDPVFCVNEYARHKFAAEGFALACSGSLVLRTSFLGARKKGQKNIINWAIDSLLRKDQIELFGDAWTSSVDVETFSTCAIELFLDKNHRGLLNLGSSEVYSKEQLIRKLAEYLEIDHSKCLAGSIKKLSNRASCLGLDVSKAQGLLGQNLPDLEGVCRNLITNDHFENAVPYQ